MASGMKGGVSTHVLDLATGKPARGVRVHLECEEGSARWRALSVAETDQDGRCARLLPDDETLRPGVYRMIFETASYYEPQKIVSLYAQVEIVFRVREGGERFHLPLLLSPNGYTTYRGS